MIRMSGSDRVTPGSREARSSSLLVFFPWHIACIPLLSSCLYVAPVWSPPVNRRPEILQPETTTGLVLVMTAEQEVLTVLASDPDDEPIFFFWTPPPGAVVEDKYGVSGDEDFTIYYTTLSIDHDPRLDGRTIQLLVTDGNEGNQQFLRWTVEVPQ